MVEAGSNVGSIGDKLTINLQKNIYKKKGKSRKNSLNQLNLLRQGGNKMEYEMKSGDLSKALK